MDLLEKYSLRFLTINGTNPFNSTFTDKMRCILQILAYILLVVSLLFSVFFIITDMHVAVDNLTTIGVACQVLLKDIDILINRKKYTQVVDCVNEFWPDDKFGTRAMIKVNRIRARLIKFVEIYLWLIVFGIASFFLKTIVEREKNLPALWIAFCDLNNSPCYVINYVAQVLCVLWGMMGLLSYDFMIILLLGLGYREFEQIKCGFLELPINETVAGDDAEALEQIRDLVKQHNLVLEFIDGIRGLLSKILVFQFVAVSYMICSSLFLLSAVGFPPPKSTIYRIIPYLASVFGQNLLFCIAGQLISDQSTSVADAAYASKWWAKTQPRLRRAICLVILRSQRESQISAAGIIKVDLNTFVAVTKTTSSVLAFANAIFQ